MAGWVSISRCAAALAAISGVMVASPCASSDQGDQEIYRCHTRSGRFDGRIFPNANKSAVYGDISLHTAIISPRWASMGKIVLRQSGVHTRDDDCGCDGVAVYAFKNPDHVEFHMLANGEDVPIAQSPYDRPVSFRISVSPQGVMTVAIGGTRPEIRTATLRHPEHDTLEMSCSGADVSFLNIASS